MSTTVTASQPLPTISIVTATYNAAACLPNLIASLAAQSDQEFEWVIADGGSSDSTLGLIDEAQPSLRRIILSCQPDFGIYDALNRGVKLAQGAYYLVVGADDRLHPEAVANYKKAILDTRADLVTARIRSGANLRGPRARSWPWLYGPFAHVSGHAVGLAVRRSLHDSVGFYSRKLPIAADQLFILKAIKSGARVSVHSFEAGSFDAEGGTSGQDILGTLLEGYRAQLATNQSKLVQTALLLLRLIKNWPSIHRGL